MTNTFEVVTVRFHQIFPSQDIDVPLAEAWDFYEDRERRVIAGESNCCLDGYFKAIVRRSDGTEFVTFAKAWTVWDFSRRVHRLARIGLGANGDGGPRNPDAGVFARQTQHLEGEGINRHWVAGINHT